jgi:protein-L-isoaspartate(D-aspartate) O-methyltransferase
VSNVTVVLGDGAQGWDQGEGSYDVIMLSGALPTLPEAFLKQLKVGGRLLAIVGAAPAMSAEIVTRVSESAFNTRKLFETSVGYLRNAKMPPQFKF